MERESAMQSKTAVLIEALPYIQKYKGKVVVIKCSGKVLEDEGLKESLVKDISLLNHVGIKPVIVHGGGKMLDEAMEKKKIPIKKISGLRVTDAQTISLVEEVFRAIAHDLVAHLRGAGDKAAIVGKSIIRVIQKDPQLGYVGEVKKIVGKKVIQLLSKGVIPVISSIGVGKKGQPYNINADTVATAIAIAIHAEKLTILTDVDGVMEHGSLIPTLSIAQVRQKIKSGIISQGMIPKAEACVDAVNGNVHKAHLINGTTPHALLLEIFTDTGIGTEIVP